MELLAWGMGKKKTSIHLRGLIASIEFKDLLRWAFISNKVMKETWEVRRIFDPNHIYQAKVRSNLVVNYEQRFCAIFICPPFQHLYAYPRLSFTTKISLLVALTLIPVILRTYGDHRIFREFFWCVFRFLHFQYLVFPPNSYHRSFTLPSWPS